MSILSRTVFGEDKEQGVPQTGQLGATGTRTADLNHEETTFTGRIPQAKEETSGESKISRSLPSRKSTLKNDQSSKENLRKGGQSSEFD